MLPEINCRILFSAFRNPKLRRMWIRCRAAISHRQILGPPNPPGGLNRDNTFTNNHLLIRLEARHEGLLSAAQKSLESIMSNFYLPTFICLR